MPITKDELKDTLKIVEYGLFLHTLLVMLDFGFDKNKTEMVDQLKDMVQKFDKSLTDDERKEYRERVDAMIKQKTADLYTTLETELGEKDRDEVIDSMQNELTLNSITEKLKNYTPLKPQLLK